MLYYTLNTTALKWLNRRPGSTKAEVNARLSPAKSDFGLVTFRAFGFRVSGLGFS